MMTTRFLFLAISIIFLYVGATNAVNLHLHQDQAKHPNDAVLIGGAAIAEQRQHDEEQQRAPKPKPRPLEIHQRQPPCDTPPAPKNWDAKAAEVREMLVADGGTAMLVDLGKF